MSCFIFVPGRACLFFLAQQDNYHVKKVLPVRRYRRARNIFPRGPHPYPAALYINGKHFPILSCIVLYFNPQFCIMPLIAYVISGLPYNTIKNAKVPSRRKILTPGAFLGTQNFHANYTALIIVINLC